MLSGVSYKNNRTQLLPHLPLFGELFISSCEKLGFNG